MTLTALWLVLLVVLIWFRAALLPFGLALLLAFILEPIVNWLNQQQIRGKRIPRSAAIIGIYVVGLSLLLLVGSWMATQIGRELAGLGAVARTLLTEVRQMSQDILSSLAAFASEHQLPFQRHEIQHALEKNLIGVTEELLHDLTSLVSLGRDVVGGTFRAIFGGFLVLMLAAFMSMDKRRIERFFFTLTPPEYRSDFTSVIGTMSVGLAGVVRGQATICFVNGVLTFIGLWLMGVKLPLILATVAALFSLIPIFGSILSTIPIVAMALTDSVAKGLLALIWIIVIHLVEANLLNPKIMGDAARIHPVIVVFALIVGEQTAGLMGALFAVPIASVLLTVFKFLHDRALAADTPEVAVASGPSDAKE